MAVPELAELRRNVIARRATRARGPELPHVEDLTGPGGLALRRYRPAGGELPVLVFAHGGAWVICDLDSHDRLCRRIAQACGVEVIAVDYRLAPENPYPAAIDDVAAVIRWARPAAVAGDSAGGYLATMACLRLRDAGEPLPAVQALMCPNTDLTLSSPSVADKGEGYALDQDFLAWATRQWAPGDADRNDPLASPLLVPDLSGMPDTLIVTAEHDALRDEGDAYAVRLAAAGNRVVHRVEPGLMHGFVQNADPESDAATDRLLASLRELLG